MPVVPHGLLVILLSLSGVRASEHPMPYAQGVRLFFCPPTRPCCPCTQEALTEQAQERELPAMLEPVSFPLRVAGVALFSWLSCFPCLWLMDERADAPLGPLVEEGIAEQPWYVLVSCACGLAPACCACAAPMAACMGLEWCCVPCCGPGCMRHNMRDYQQALARGWHRRAGLCLVPSDDSPLRRIPSVPRQLQMPALPRRLSTVFETESPPGTPEELDSPETSEWPWGA